MYVCAKQSAHGHRYRRHCRHRCIHRHEHNYQQLALHARRRHRWRCHFFSNNTNVIMTAFRIRYNYYIHTHAYIPAHIEGISLRCFSVLLDKILRPSLVIVHYCVLFAALNVFVFVTIVAIVVAVVCQVSVNKHAHTVEHLYSYTLEFHSVSGMITIPTPEVYSWGIVKYNTFLQI